MLSLKLTKEILGADQVVVEDAPCDLEQIGNQRVSHGVAHADALFATGHDVGRTKNGKLLGHDRLVDAQRFLQFLDAFLAVDHQLQNPDPDRVSEGPEECGLERLEFIRGPATRPITVVNTRHVGRSRRCDPTSDRQLLLYYLLCMSTHDPA